MNTSPQSHRGTIFLEDGVVIGQEQWPDEQYVIRITAPKCAKRALPGSFVHIRCGNELPMRRPLSIQRSNPEAGWIEILYKTVGKGLSLLAAAKAGDHVSCLGPIGHGFTVHANKPRRLLIGGGVGIPPMIFLAEHLTQEPKDIPLPLVLMGSEIPFPFTPRPSTLLVPGIPREAIASMPLLEDWGIPSRLASRAGRAGCFDGYVTELAAHWLATLGAKELSEVEIFACGPTPMLEACARVAQRLGVAAQVSLEEYMACAVGGCAGCTVPVTTEAGIAMKRVCVDGPVFEANSVFPPLA